MKTKNVQGSAKSFFSARRIFLVAIVGYGIGIRLGEYLANRSLWFDEAMLALNIIHKSSWELITQPLDYNQTAPIGFLALTKQLVLMFGNGELVLRAVPFLSGIISVPLFYNVIKKFSARKTALIALVLFSFSSSLLFHNTEFKQYSSDVFFALIISLLGVVFLTKKLTFQRGILLGMGGAAMIWFSHPAVFMLGGIGLTLLVFYFSNKRWRECALLCASFILWGLSLIVLYGLSLKAMGNNVFLENAWQRNFMPFPPQSIRDLGWFVDSFIQLFSDPGAIRQTFFGAAAFVLGSYSMFKRDKYLFWMALMPIILALGVSGIGYYPFTGRLLLFYVPFLYLFIAEGLVFLMDKRSYVLRGAGVVMLAIIVWSPSITAYRQVTQRMFYSEELKPVLDYLREHREKEDFIYIYYGAEYAFRYYAGQYGFDEDNFIKGSKSRKDWKKYCDDLDQFERGGRVWFIFSHVYFREQRSEEKYMVDYLESIGDRLDTIQATSASAYLYEFAAIKTEGM